MEKKSPRYLLQKPFKNFDLFLDETIFLCSNLIEKLLHCFSWKLAFVGKKCTQKSCKKG
jgi:hypothetical protein